MVTDIQKGNGLKRLQTMKASSGVPTARKIRSLSNDKIEEFQSENESMPEMTDEHNITIPNIYSNEKNNGPRNDFSGASSPRIRNDESGYKNIMPSVIPSTWRAD